jgi:hypothetical protein
VLVVASPEQTDDALQAGRIACPGCRGKLRPHGYARTRTVRDVGAARLTLTPRRARCTGCGATHVLLPAELTARRADSTAAIGVALLAKAEHGHGHRRIAASMGRPSSTVRRWLRGVRGGQVERLRRAGVAEVNRLDAEQLPSVLEHLNRSPLWRALNVLAIAARTARQRYGSTVPPWALIGWYVRGQLIAPLRQSTA